MKNLIVSNTPIRQDAEGRFCLNDFHHASGGAKKNGPSYWLALKQTQDLISELSTTGISVVTLEGSNGGTFVCRELVYSYAMWISPSFHIRVIRTFDAVVNGDKAPPDNAVAIEAYKAAYSILMTVPGLDQAMAAACTLRCIQNATGTSMEDMRRLLPSLQEAAPSMNATAVGAELNVSPRVANAMLSDAGLQLRNARGELELTPEGRKYGRLLPFNNNGHSGYQILWMPEVVDQVRRAA